MDSDETEVFRAELDSLAQTSSAASEAKMYPFNPNFISDYKGYILGMSTEQIDALQAYRSQDRWINSKEQFQQVTGVSQKWLDSIAPFFKFPEWVNKTSDTNRSLHRTKKKTFSEKMDLNLASVSDLQRVYGIGPALSRRITDYRDHWEGGFADDIELMEVYGLDEELINRVKEDFTVKTPRNILKIKINEASSDELVTIPYIDYEIAYKIIEFRTLHEGIRTLEELTKIEDFPENKIKLIGLYLQF
jgi:DNA uptake protein ComE-like DNA-binding protein